MNDERDYEEEKYNEGLMHEEDEEMAASLKRDAPDPEKYWDLVEEANRNSLQYTDFEGMADIGYVRLMLNEPHIVAALDIFSEGRKLFLRDMVAHYVYENLDQGGYETSANEAINFIHNLSWVFNCRYWMKVDAKED